MVSPKQTREEWLIKATQRMYADIFPKESNKPDVLVSIGLPRSRSKKGAHAIGQCWSGTLSQDGRHHLFISPVLDDKVTILATLLHELVHSSVGVVHGHQGEFIKLAKAVGLVKPWTATSPDDACRTRLGNIASAIGTLDHSRLNPATLNLKKQTTRLRLYECDHGQKIRAATDSLTARCLECDSDFILVEA